MYQRQSLVSEERYTPNLRNGLTRTERVLCYVTIIRITTLGQNKKLTNYFA